MCFYRCNERSGVFFFFSERKQRTASFPKIYWKKIAVHAKLLHKRLKWESEEHRYKEVRDA